MSKIKVFLVIAAILTALSGCASAPKTENTSTAGVKTVIMGTGNSYKPIAYLDEDGNLTGFEKALIEEIDKRLPQYDFKIEIMDFTNILISLDAGKIDLAAHNFEKNEERVDKYQYGNEAYAESDMRIVVDKNRTDINSVEDLAGKTVYVDIGSNTAYLAEKYNKEHNDVLKLTYGKIDYATLTQNLINGTYDATFAYKGQLKTINEQFGEKVKIVGDTVSKSGVYYVAKKGDTELLDAIDGAIRELKQDGTLARLHLEWYSEQSIPADAVQK
jgi:L-cystine transport system substrate-binding protein